MSHKASALRYRPEIDGLRAIAVLSVMVYHLKLTFGGAMVLPGGFLGVDLFFVLSGYLITHILLAEFYKTGRISIVQFYVRRSRRILPPLLLVILFSLPAAWYILLPGELQRFAVSIGAALLFISNFFWFFELSEYGAQSGLLQPFLHTWSLAIEEQFYLVFPPVLLLVLRARGAGWAFGVCAVALGLSFVAAVAMTLWHPAFSFYAPTSRAWELLAGSMLAFWAHQRSRQKIGQAAPSALTQAIPALSLVVLLGCFATLYLPDIAHPGFVTLPVILATCGLIQFAHPSDPVTRGLSYPALVWVGRLSYSLYLWHFPVFSFGRLVTMGAPGPLDLAGFFVLTFGLAAAGYYAVEKPFRFTLSPRAFGLAIGAGLLPIVALVALVAGGIVTSTARTGDLAQLYGAAEIDNSILAADSWGPLAALSPNETIGSWNAQRPSEHEKNDLWFAPDDTRRVLVIGDSHAKDVFNALVLNGDKFPQVGFARFNLHPKSLGSDLALLLTAPNFAASDTVLIAPRYYREYRETLAEILAALARHGKRVIVVGNTVEFDVGGDLPLFDWYLRSAGKPEVLRNLNALAPKFESLGGAEREASLRDLAQAAGVEFLSRRDLICPPAGHSCTLVTADGRKTMYDDTHWTLAGAALFGARAAAAGWLAR